MFGAMAGLLVVALCVPEAFGDRALAFAVAYGVVRLGHIALFLIASRDDARAPPLGRRLRASAPRIVDRAARRRRRSSTAARRRRSGCVAILLDWGAPALFGVERVATGPRPLRRAAQPRDHPRPRRVDRGARRRRRGRPHRARDRRRRARDRARGGPVVDLLRRRRPRDRAAPRCRRPRAVSATRSLATRTPTCTSRWSPGSCSAPSGSSEILAHVDEPLDAVHAFALLGGTAIYLLAHVALRLRNARTINVERLALAVVLVRADPGGGRTSTRWSRSSPSTSSSGR